MSCSGDVRNITYRDSVVGDALGSSPWAIKIKTDSQEGGVVDGVYFRNLTIGNITMCALRVTDFAKRMHTIVRITQPK